MLVAFGDVAKAQDSVSDMDSSSGGGEAPPLNHNVIGSRSRARTAAHTNVCAKGASQGPRRCVITLRPRGRRATVADASQLRPRRSP